MTNINCSSNCIHQLEGKCTFDSVSKNPTSFSSDCIFFEEKLCKQSDKTTSKCFLNGL